MAAPDVDDKCSFGCGLGGPLIPRCQYHHCRKPARWTVRLPAWGKGRPFGGFSFMCDGCRNTYAAAMSTPMKGIDRPAGPDGEDWKGSILEHIRHGQIALAFEERVAREKEGAAVRASDLWRDGDERFTAAQLGSMFAWRAGLRRMRLEGNT